MEPQGVCWRNKRKQSKNSLGEIFTVIIPGSSFKRIWGWGQTGRYREVGPASRACDGQWLRAWAQTGPSFGLMLCSHHLEILNNKGLMFPVCTGRCTLRGQSCREATRARAYVKHCRWGQWMWWRGWPWGYSISCSALKYSNNEILCIKQLL